MTTPDSAPPAPQPIRLALTIDLEVEIHDAAAVCAAALAEGAGPDAAADPAWALVRLLDPGLMLAQIPGVTLGEEPVEVGIAEIEDTPEFTVLFPPPPEDDEDPETWWLTPRTAALLHGELRTLAQDAAEDLEELGDTPITETDGRYVFDRLPAVTWTQNADWRLQFARSCDDLADDLERGAWPTPRCAAEAIALHFALQDTGDTLESEPDLVDELTEALPEHDADFDLDAAADLLFQDRDLLLLLDPDDEADRHHGIGELPPHSWFEPYGDAKPRDPGRGHRHL